jgi:predicted nucleic-acid-binding protein
MIAVDTNIVVRLLSRDEESQYQRAYRLFNDHKVFISTTVALECEWVLRYAYQFSPLEIIAALRRLFGLENVVLEEGERIAMALEWHEQGLDFADALHLAASPEDAPFFTFDRKLIKGSHGVSRQDVREPD